MAARTLTFALVAALAFSGCAPKRPDIAKVCARATERAADATTLARNSQDRLERCYGANYIAACVSPKWLPFPTRYVYAAEPKGICGGHHFYGWVRVPDA